MLKTLADLRLETMSPTVSINGMTVEGGLRIVMEAACQLSLLLLAGETDIRQGCAITCDAGKVITSKGRFNEIFVWAENPPIVKSFRYMPPRKDLREGAQMFISNCWETVGIVRRYTGNSGMVIEQ